MKFIDEKGRLFGKFNIIDILIVLVVLAAFVGVNYKLGLIKKFSSSDVNVKKPIVKIWIKNISRYTVDSIKEGDTLKELKSNTAFGKIIAIEVKPTKDVGVDLEGKWVISEVPEKNDVFLTVEAFNPPVNGDVKLGSKDAKAGASIDIVGPKFQVNSYVIGVE